MSVSDAVALPADFVYTRRRSWTLWLGTDTSPIRSRSPVSGSSRSCSSSATICGTASILRTGLAGRSVYCLFYEPSFLTRTSFERAIELLGGQAYHTEDASQFFPVRTPSYVDNIVNILASFTHRPRGVAQQRQRRGGAGATGRRAARDQRRERRRPSDAGLWRTFTR